MRRLGGRVGVGLITLVACHPLDDQAPANTTQVEPVVTAAPRTRSPRSAALPDFAAVTEQIAPSVVSVICTFPQTNGRPKRGVGSGTVVRADGLVVTNAHVVPLTAETIEVVYADQERVRVQVVHREPLLDLAVVAPETARIDHPALVFRERRVRPGEWVLAVGHPFGLGDTVTVGVVSGLGRDWNDVGKPLDLPPDGYFSFVQTDASINAGNSGGPIVDLRGEAIGIATAVRGEGQGIGFAVPAPMVRRYLAEVLAHGRFRRVRLGINAADDEDFPGRIATVKVTLVDPAGPGAQAGLSTDDYILAIAGQPVRRVSELAYLTQLLGVDAPIELQVQRAGEPPRAATLKPAEAN